MTQKTPQQRQLERAINKAREEQKMKLFYAMLQNAGLPVPVREHKFNELVLSKTGVPRKWRFDYAWLNEKVALEVEGGVFTRGRHTRGKGFMDDLEKYEAARLQGWVVIKCVPRTLITIKTLDMIREGLRLQREKYIYVVQR